MAFLYQRSLIIGRVLPARPRLGSSSWQAAQKRKVLKRCRVPEVPKDRPSMLGGKPQSRSEPGRRAQAVIHEAESRYQYHKRSSPRLSPGKGMRKRLNPGSTRTTFGKADFIPR